MNHHRPCWLAWLVCCAAAWNLSAQELPPPVRLPAPQKDGGRPLMQTLNDRRSTREFAPTPLSEQQMANLLWAAFGVNRPDGHRTAPSAMNAQELDLYVVTARGVYRYDAAEHQLAPVAGGDRRAQISGQAYVREAPVCLVFVADLARMTKARAEEREFYAAADTGYVSQNVYLFCASERLATVVFALGDRAGIARALQLRPEQRPILAQSVGHFKDGPPAQ